MKNLGSFLCGALVGAALAALFAPEKGEDLRSHIRLLLIKHGIIPARNYDSFVSAFASEIED